MLFIYLFFISSLNTLDSNCYKRNYKTYLQSVLTHAGYNECMRRNKVTRRWRLTARGLSCMTVLPALLVLYVPHWTGYLKALFTYIIVRRQRVWPKCSVQAIHGATGSLRDSAVKTIPYRENQTDWQIGYYRTCRTTGSVPIYGPYKAIFFNTFVMLNKIYKWLCPSYSNTCIK